MLLLNRLVAPLGGTVATLSERIIYGVPVFVPLRFADLAVLAARGAGCAGAPGAAGTAG